MYDAFADYGQIRNLQVNLDRRTASIKGYAIVEFESYEDALAAVQGKDGKQLLGQTLEVNFAFKGASRRGH